MTTEAEFNAVWDDENDDDAPWYNPAPSNMRHRMPDLDGIVACCGCHVDSLPAGEWQTADPERGTCGEEAGL